MILSENPRIHSPQGISLRKYNKYQTTYNLNSNGAGMYSGRQMSPPVMLQCDIPTTRLVQFIIILAPDLPHSHPWKSLYHPKVY